MNIVCAWCAGPAACGPSPPPAQANPNPFGTATQTSTTTTTTASKDAEGHEHRSTSVEGHRDSVVSREDGTFSFFRQQPAAVQIAPKKTGSLPELLVLPALGEEAERSQLDLGDLVLRKGRMLTGRVAKTTVASRSRAPGSRRSGEPGRAFPSGASGPPRRRTGRSGSTGSSPAPRSR